jgi:two-component system, OmpR family, sensor kinase
VSHGNGTNLTIDNKAVPTAIRSMNSLAGKLVMIGLIQLILLALVAVVIFIAQGSPHPPPPFDVVNDDVAARLQSVADDHDKLQQAIDKILDDRVEISIYDDDLQLVATTATPPLSVPPRQIGKPRGFDRDRPPGPSRTEVNRRGPPPAVRDFTIHGSQGYLVARGIPRDSFTVAPIVLLFIGMAIVIVGALLTARWIVRPIDQLSAVAREIGSGKLATRSNFHRSDEIGELGLRIDEMAEHIELLVARERELLANVAHELRTPLARIGVAIDIAHEGDAESARCSLAEIATDTSELVAIIDDIFTASRFDARPGSVPLQRITVAANDISRAAEDRFRTRHHDRNLVVTTESTLPAIDVDPVLFRRVIDNLLDNAHKYSPELATPVALRVSVVASRVVYTVEDNGVGIAQQDLVHVFAAFFRGDRSRTRQTGGVGLGLTLAKRIVEAHGGSIEVVSALGQGTRVTVSVPCDVAATT